MSDIVSTGTRSFCGRTITNIAIEPAYDRDSAAYLWALCNDGTLWYTPPNTKHEESKQWFKFTLPIPQDGDEKL